MHGHRDLIAWQRAMELVTELYRVTSTFPREELYGLVSQLRRAAVSVPSNLAEGNSRNSRNEFHHFIGQARGSLAEIETQIEIARNLGFVTAEACNVLLAKVDGVGRLLAGLRAWSRTAPLSTRSNSLRATRDSLL
jgi:four helix bundle protein